MFCVRNFLDLTFSLTDVSISSITFSTPEILASISCILLVMFLPIVPVHTPRFSISRIPSVYVFFIAFISTFRSWTVLFISFTSLIVIFLYVFKGFSAFLLKGLYHLYKIGFKVIFLYFVSVRAPRACSSSLLCSGGVILPWLLW